MSAAEMKTAVALKYSADDTAPVIAAKAKGFLARRMIEIAEAEKIPCVEDAALANFLTVQEVGDAVPEETWEAVAKIFAFVVKLDSKEGKRNGDASQDKRGRR